MTDPFALGIAAGTAQTAPLLIGFGLGAFGAVLLWYRADLYWAYQWIIQYPRGGFRYVLVQYVTPLICIAAGIALILYPATGW